MNEDNNDEGFILPGVGSDNNDVQSEQNNFSNEPDNSIVLPGVDTNNTDATSDNNSEINEYAPYINPNYVNNQDSISNSNVTDNSQTTIDQFVSQNNPQDSQSVSGNDNTQSIQPVLNDMQESSMDDSTEIANNTNNVAGAPINPILANASFNYAQEQQSQPVTNNEPASVNANQANEINNYAINQEPVMQQPDANAYTNPYMNNMNQTPYMNSESNGVQAPYMNQDQSQFNNNYDSNAQFNETNYNNQAQFNGTNFENQNGSNYEVPNSQFNGANYNNQPQFNNANFEGQNPQISNPNYFDQNNAQNINESDKVKDKNTKIFTIVLVVALAVAIIALFIILGFKLSSKNKAKTSSNNTIASQQEQPEIEQYYFDNNEYSFDYDSTKWTDDEESKSLVYDTYSLQYAMNYNASQLGADFKTDNGRSALYEMIINQFSSQASGANLQMETPNDGFISKDDLYYTFFDILDGTTIYRYYLVVLPDDNVMFQFTLSNTDTSIDYSTGLEVVDMLASIQKADEDNDNTNGLSTNEVGLNASDENASTNSVQNKVTNALTNSTSAVTDTTGNIVANTTSSSASASNSTSANSTKNVTNLSDLLNN